MEYRLTAEPTKLASVWEASPTPAAMGISSCSRSSRQQLMEAYKKRIGLTDPLIREAGAPPSSRRLGLTMILGRLQQPPKEWTLRGEVNTRQFFGALPFRARAISSRRPAARPRLLQRGHPQYVGHLRETPKGGNL